MMKPRRKLSLHHLTALDVAPVDLPGYAAQTGCEYVGIFCDLPGVKEARFPVISAGESELQFQRALAEHNVSVNNIELFQIRPQTDVNALKEGFAMGNRLGARQVTVHIHAANHEFSVAAFSQLCLVASDYGLDVALEFTSFSAVRTLDAALNIIRSANLKNGRIALDLLHFFRNGGKVEDINDIKPHELGYIQVCDGLYKKPEDLYAEAVKDRMLPGEGEFPIQQVMSLLPEDVIVDVEIPQMRLKNQGINAGDRISMAVERTLATITPYKVMSSR